MNLVIPSTARNLPEHMSTQVGPGNKACSIEIPRFARNFKIVYLYTLTEHVDNTAQAEQNAFKGE